MINTQTILKDHPDFFQLVQDRTNNETNNKSNSKINSKIDDEIGSVTPPEHSRKDSLTFLSQTVHLSLLPQLQSKLWVVTDAFWKSHSVLIREAAQTLGAEVMTCRNLQMAMAHILFYFDRRESLFAFPKGISPQSWIHPSAQIAAGVTVAPFTTIGPGVKIQEKTVIGPHCTIEGEVEIGSDCFLESHVFIGRQTQIGNHCRLKPFASIGADGFGYAPVPQPETPPLKIPQIGTVKIEDFVDIGSGSCIDRATLTYTRIGRGTKIDNLVHIAHNCDIGRYCFLTAGFAIAGSSQIGDYFMTGGATVVGDHVRIADKVMLAGATVVTSDILQSGNYGGDPVQSMQDYLKTRATATHLPQLRKQLHRVLKHLNLKD